MKNVFQELDILYDHEKKLVNSHCKTLLKNESIVGFESLTCDSFNIIVNPFKTFNRIESDKRFTNLFEFAIQQTKPTKRIIVFKFDYSKIIKENFNKDMNVGMITFICIVSKIDDLSNIKHRVVSRLYSLEENEFVSNWRRLTQKEQLDIINLFTLKEKWVR